MLSFHSCCHTVVLDSSAEIVYYAAFPCHEVALHYVLARIGHQTQVKCQIVNASYLQRKQLLSLEQMVQIGFGMYAVDVASVRIDG